MTADATNPVPYETPAIDERTQIGVPMTVVGSGVVCAAFRSVTVVYEPPAIEERTQIDLPLVGGPAASGVTSAAFRPTLRD